MDREKETKRGWGEGEERYRQKKLNIEREKGEREKGGRKREG